MNEQTSNIMTQLPEKSRFKREDIHVDMLQLSEKFNQLIDYLAELTEVVEGKQYKERVEPYLPQMCVCGEVDTLGGAEDELREVYREIISHYDYYGNDSAYIKRFAQTRGIDISDKK